MKKILFTILLLVSGLAFAGDVINDLSISAIPTNATATVEDMSLFRYSGNVYAVELDFGGYASPTVDVDIVTVTNASHKVQKTILSMDNLTVDGIYYPRVIADTTAGVDIANTPVLIRLNGEKVKVQAYGANVTNVITLDVKIDLE